MGDSRGVAELVVLAREAEGLLCPKPLDNRQRFLEGRLTLGHGWEREGHLVELGNVVANAYTEHHAAPTDPVHICRLAGDQ